MVGEGLKTFRARFGSFFRDPFSRFSNLYTEQMDAEGLGRKLLLTPSGDPRRNPEKQTVGAATASHKMLTLEALRAPSMPALQRGAAWAEERFLGTLRQSVPQNGRVHLHIMIKPFFKLNRGVSKPGCFPLFSGKVQIVSRTLSGQFLVGALNRPRKRKRANRENPRTVPEQIGKIPEKSGKSQKGQKRTKKDKKGRTSPDRETPPFETPPFSGP